MEKISIIVPVYNVENYLSRCIDSIVNQTYKELEIILVNDGSTDRCPQICEEYAALDQRIQVVHKSNGGLSDARNVGIDMSSGRYLMFVDSDDYIDICMVQKLYEAVAEHDADLGICNFKYVGDEPDSHYDNRNLPIRNEVIGGSEVLNQRLFQKKSWYWVVAVCKLYRRELFDQVRFPVGKLHEDEFILHRILLQCSKIACIATPMYSYYQRKGSIMDRKKDVKKLDGAEALFLRAEELSTRKEFERAAVKSLLAGASHFHSYYFSVCFDYDNEHIFCNRTLQNQYRAIIKKLRIRQAHIKKGEVVKLILNYISLFYCGKMVWVIRLKLKPIILQCKREECLCK